jgi:SAM-dependent methyltransferase
VAKQVLKRYAAKLKSEGISDSEIARRIRLICTERAALDADHYSRLYLDSDANFNHEPNAFLVEVARGRQPGVALDDGMGQGRNVIYLAGLGWDVWGFDPAEGGIGIAQKRARELGLRLHTASVRDDEYDFGQSKVDLILFSWTEPLVPVQRVVDALKPGGVVVMERGDEFVAERNTLLHQFDAIQIVRHEIGNTIRSVQLPTSRRWRVSRQEGSWGAEHAESPTCRLPRYRTNAKDRRAETAGEPSERASSQLGFWNTVPPSSR